MEAFAVDVLVAGVGDVVERKALAVGHDVCSAILVGFTIEGLPDDATEEQVIELLEKLLGQLPQRAA